MVEVTSTAYKIKNYKRGDNKRIENLLMVYNNTYYRYEEYGMAYDEEEEILYIPRGIDIEIVRGQFHDREFVYVDSNKYNRCNFSMIHAPRDVDQKRIISYLTGIKDYAYTKRYNQIIVDMQTGSGKTYCTIAAISIFKVKALIINYDNGIRTQWTNSILEHTDMVESDILTLSTTIVKDIMENRLDVSNIKIFNTNHDTLRIFADTYGWNKLNDLMIKLGVGIKVYDEADMRTENMFKIDFFTRVAKTIYLTATLMKSNRFENAIYQMALSAIPKYGKELFKDKQEDIVAMIFSYDSKPSIRDQAICKNKEGFSGVLYGKYAFRDYSMPVYKMISKAITMSNNIVREENQICIYAARKDCINDIKDYLINDMGISEDDILIYNSDNKSKTKDTDLKTKKYILTTAKSMGRAKDVPNLRMLIMTEAFSSPSMMEQVLGRLRKGGYYIEGIDKGFKSIPMQYRSRKKIIESKCTKIYNTELK